MKDVRPELIEFAASIEEWLQKHVSDLSQELNAQTVGSLYDGMTCEMEDLICGDASHDQVIAIAAYAFVITQKKEML